MTRERCVKDVGVMMSEDLASGEHNKGNFESYKRMIGWIMSSFTTREAGPVTPPLKAPVFSRLEYCWLPKSYEAAEIRLEDVFTSPALVL